jgi:RNA polymerase sigma-70 factor (ECF subfamily)
MVAMSDSTADLGREAKLEKLWGIWRQHRRFVVEYARVLNSRSGTEADDLVADVLLRAAEATLRNRGPDRDPRAWFKVILHRSCIDRYRRRHRSGIPTTSSELDEVPDCAPNPESAVVARQREEQILARLETLPHSWRQALEMRVLQAYSYANIATIQKVSPANARKRVQLARAALQGNSRSDERFV